MDGVDEHNRGNRREKIISLEHRKQKLSHEQKRKQNEKKWSLWDLRGWCKSPTVTSLEAWKEEGAEIRTEKAPGGITPTAINLQIQEGDQTPNEINSKPFIRRHIIVKLLKVQDKEKTLKAARGNNPLPIGEQQFKGQVSQDLQGLPRSTGRILPWISEGGKGRSLHHLNWLMVIPGD